MRFREWNEIIKDKSPLKVIYFWTDWCEECGAQYKELSKIEDWEGFGYASVNADERPDIAIRYSPQIYPSLAIVTEGNVVGGLYGFSEEWKIRETLLMALDLSLGGGKLVSPKFNRDLRKVPRSNYVLQNERHENILNDIRSKCISFFDIYQGGFEKEPKYYLPNVLRFLLRFKDSYSMEIVKYTLDAVIYNLWDNGFYAFSKTYDWKNPYKVKLLDLNAEMIIALLETFAKTKDTYYLDYAVETGKWLMRSKKGDFYPIAETSQGMVGKPLLTVNSLIGEAMFYLYEFTNDESFRDEAERLSSLLKPSHVIGDGNPFLLDLAYLIRFLSSLGKGKEVVKVAFDQFFGGDAFYDVSLPHALSNGIGRFKLITDNSILGQGLVKLGLMEPAKQIANYFSTRYWNFTYFNQADFGLLVWMLNEHT
ncbi:conserved protein containing a thioredoxin domain-like protein [Metallosphaera sedula]|uniref:Conserved protein containing a thioredoxin domain-like protein n=3 Tax=Metallosphaera TaxID=41980 RepID=A4YFA9_METS5|nr:MULTISPECIES: thioredoxin domain-containing protein [Metallosphaera]ABP95111.1 conserved protein containing a thioredoxin domain-like protein [Metallosphaera sedula DSM 5348]AIM27097.1 conserved protein containing a thioredoxin domain-like protein [Metallosphaera sedula]AKV74007.1 thioredoxin [Metallosphaera sedula]AKV76245.1 thioredoxin [Metallosphaera sedula]AKV78499.1 thioredoxin [Metallosphaera sedula]